MTGGEARRAAESSYKSLSGSTSTVPPLVDERSGSQGAKNRRTARADSYSFSTLDHWLVYVAWFGSKETRWSIVPSRSSKAFTYASSSDCP